ncbi:hypothetical protein B4U79_18929 [Dinothrombium tinctorium]|uniref:Uncharacterized protein n=1 Tax=Dinothrombium tinctorium TaxID=1965070 RepID=A0A3S3PWS3_9ACAR|nr:hypothetical protein B4U79_18929 [Dinothrombium tinctorium]
MELNLLTSCFAFLLFSLCTSSCFSEKDGFEYLQQPSIRRGETLECGTNAQYTIHAAYLDLQNLTNVIFTVLSSGRSETYWTKFVKIKKGKWFRTFDGFPKRYIDWLNKYDVPSDIDPQTFIPTGIKDRQSLTQEEYEILDFIQGIQKREIEYVTINRRYRWNDWRPTENECDYNTAASNISSILFIRDYQNYYTLCKKRQANQIYAWGSIKNMRMHAPFDGSSYTSHFLSRKFSNNQMVEEVLLQPIFKNSLQSIFVLTFFNDKYGIPTFYNASFQHLFFTDHLGSTFNNVEIDEFSDNEWKLLVNKQQLFGCPIDESCLRFFVDEVTRINEIGYLFFMGRYVAISTSLDNQFQEPIFIDDYFQISEIEIPYYIDAVYHDPRQRWTFIFKDDIMWTLAYDSGKQSWSVIDDNTTVTDKFPRISHLDCTLYISRDGDSFVYVFNEDERAVLEYRVTFYPMQLTQAEDWNIKWIEDVNSKLPSRVDACFRENDTHIQIVRNNYFYTMKSAEFYKRQLLIPPVPFLWRFQCKYPTFTKRAFIYDYFTQWQPKPSKKSGQLRNFGRSPSKDSTTATAEIPLETSVMSSSIRTQKTLDTGEENGVKKATKNPFWLQYWMHAAIIGIAFLFFGLAASLAIFIATKKRKAIKLSKSLRERLSSPRGKKKLVKALMKRMKK